MRPADLPADEDHYAHGTRARYKCGCKCEECRKANRTYVNARYRALKLGKSQPNGLVPSDKARQHMLALSKAGIGRRTIRDITGLGDTSLQEIRSGRKKLIRAETERKILAVTSEAMNDAKLVDASHTYALIKRLLNEGFTKAELAKRLGYESPALQLRAKRITARNAHKVQKFYDAIMAGGED